MSSSEYCEIFKNTYFEKKFPTAASKLSKNVKSKMLKQNGLLVRSYILSKFNEVGTHLN